MKHQGTIPIALELEESPNYVSNIYTSLLQCVY